MNIYGLNKTTLLDYPGHVAATIFTGSCNFRCPFCQNGDLVLNPTSQPSFQEEEIFSFLNKRKTILSGVCITGGEPTLQKDLPMFIKKIKDLGYLVKLDTNGYRPDVLKQLLDSNLLDMVSMDIKSCPSNYAIAAGLSSIDLEKINTSILLLLRGTISYEFRTTVVEELHNENTFFEISDWINHANSYALQCYQDSDSVIAPGYHAPSKESLYRYLEIVKEKIPNAFLRGID